MKKRIIVYHDNLFGKSIGGSEKLLHDFIRILWDSGLFDVFAVYGENNGKNIPADLIPKCNCLPFAHSYRETVEPFRCFDMQPDLNTILSIVDPSLFICSVWANNQFPINNLPSKIPLFLISPFGAFCSNNNIRRLYVAGASCTSQLRKLGVWYAEVFFSPLNIPPLNDSKCKTKSKNEQIVFGRCGRPDSDIFDPISLQAFAKLEGEYHEKVKYIYVNPSSKARDLVRDLKLQQVEFKEWLSESQLNSFYQEIDVFAHSRVDGETLGVAIAEAMLAQNPVISHVSRYHNDHKFLLREPFGKIAGIDDWQQYYRFMKFFVENREGIPDLGLEARRFAIPLFDKAIVSKKVIRDVSEAASYYGKPRPFFQNIYRGCGVKKKIKSNIKCKLAKFPILYHFIIKCYQRVSEIRRRLKTLLQSWKTSFECHHSEYSQTGALERERKGCLEYEKSNFFNHTENKFEYLLSKYPDVRSIAIDIGSGTGWLSARLSREFKKVIAIEPSPSAIHIAQQLFPKMDFPNIEWRLGFAEKELKSVYADGPISFFTGCVLSHLTDDAVKKICRKINSVAPKGSILGFAECFGTESHEFMWHIRSQSWWQAQFPDWEIDFHGPMIEGIVGRHKGFHGVRIKKEKS